MHRAIRVPAGEDLRPLVALLRTQRIPHHITEESGELVVWAPDREHAALIESRYRAWKGGALDLPDPVAAQPPPMVPVKGLMQSVTAAAWLAPVTVALIAACIVVASVSKLGTDVMAVRGLFFPVLPTTGVADLLAGLSSGGLWLRTLTPALLHFGAIHLVFNMLWFWYLGRLMEPVLGVWRYALVLLLTAFSANVLQYLWEGSNNFGGMSGVVYGQLGFIWLWQLVSTERRLRLPMPMIMVFLAALVLMEILASAFIATAAHVGGLVAGMVAGAALGLMYRARYGTRQR